MATAAATTLTTSIGWLILLNQRLLLQLGYLFLMELEPLLHLLLGDFALFDDGGMQGPAAAGGLGQSGHGDARAWTRSGSGGGGRARAERPRRPTSNADRTAGEVQRWQLRVEERQRGWTTTGAARGGALAPQSGTSSWKICRANANAGGPNKGRAASERNGNVACQTVTGKIQNRKIAEHPELSRDTSSELVALEINHLKVSGRQRVWDRTTKAVGTEVKVAQPAQLPKFRWNLATELVVREVDPCEESEVGDAWWYLAIEAR
uniref:Uncharacterized protein n=1 Tax=Oryza rufipogon TaxID=4529 RepID=A0A0E0QHH0_ORYRU